MVLQEGIDVCHLIVRTLMHGILGPEASLELNSIHMLHFSVDPYDEQVEQFDAYITTQIKAVGLRTPEVDVHSSVQVVNDQLQILAKQEKQGVAVKQGRSCYSGSYYY